MLTQGVISLALALSGSFVQLALLSMVTRLLAYIGTAAAVLVLARRYRERRDVLRLPGGPLIPLAALALSLALLASASWQNLAATSVALLVGAGISFVPAQDARKLLLAGFACRSPAHNPALPTLCRSIGRSARPAQEP